MNTLAYGLLGLLTRGTQSGYDLMLKMNAFWSVAHSQIYPLLAKLEQEGFVQHAVVQQTEKPDKKVYTLTESGIAAVKEWLRTPTAEPVSRDEISLKAYCIGILDRADAQKLLAEREEYFRQRLAHFERQMTQLKQGCNGVLTDVSSPQFSSYILVQMGLGNARQGLQWCRWVQGLLEQREVTNLLELEP